MRRTPARPVSKLTICRTVVATQASAGSITCFNQNFEESIEDVIVSCGFWYLIPPKAAHALSSATILNSVRPADSSPLEFLVVVIWHGYDWASVFCGKAKMLIDNTVEKIKRDIKVFEPNFLNMFMVLVPSYCPDVVVEERSRLYLGCSPLLRLLCLLYIDWS